MNQEISLKKAQEMVDEWIHNYGVRYFSELTNMAVLTEEVGELARVISRKVWRSKLQRRRKVQPW